MFPKTTLIIFVILFTNVTFVNKHFFSKKSFILFCFVNICCYICISLKIKDCKLMKDRIQKIIDNEQLSASKFSEVIGVQRSTISHIFNGRNKPTLDIVQKILVAYPDINETWLLLGTGNMYKSGRKDNEVHIAENTETPTIEEQIIPSTEIGTKTSEPSPIVYENQISKKQNQEPSVAKTSDNTLDNKQNAKKDYNKNNQTTQKEIIFESKTDNIVTQPKYNDKKVAQNTQPQQPQPVDITKNNPEKIIVFYSNKTFTLYSPSGE